MPRPYPPQFRRRALDLVEFGRTVRDVAASLGIAESALHRWRQCDLVDRGLKAGPTSSESAELAAARARIRDLEDEVKILRKAAAALEAVVPPRGSASWRSCTLTGPGRPRLPDPGSVPARALRPGLPCPSTRSLRHAWLDDQIAAIHAALHGTYGRLRVHAELVHASGVVVGHNTVGLLMRRAQLAGLPTHRRGKRSRREITVNDLVRRDFRRTAPNQLWVTDITDHPTREGKLYCCVVIDTYPRRVVGWAIDSRQRADLATNALGMAIDSRAPSPGAIIHGDHGPQFTSWTFTERARRAGLLPSPGTVGDPYDNAVVELFWRRMQTELLNRQRWNTRAELANAIVEYRGLPQPSAAPFRARLGHPRRVREHHPPAALGSSPLSPSNGIRINLSGKPSQAPTASTTRETREPSLY